MLQGRNVRRNKVHKVQLKLIHVDPYESFFTKCSICRRDVELVSHRADPWMFVLPL